ncbi:MAG: 3'-5' exonuclease [Bacteroidales bacterium]|nr:3'-5' exonuclease [Bacteroidales bacterium]MDD3152011.1 3'-5' exonuclease [Bacteroidales bacterium]MDD3913734.1 3'-5' exonuclease [Bacteroidales bacterium]MDD4633499.1 3'-5' exonuclease [Bacteroidales bacterium]
MKDILKNLNPAQKEAVTKTEGPIMVIAGAGSGKTRVLTYKIAYLLSQNVDAFSVLSLTFTNKAAREMKERVANLIGSEAQSVWMGTFHSIFSRLLRFDGHYLGYPSTYTIYDTDDSKSVIKSVVSGFELDPKIYPANQVLSRISAAKSNLISAADYNNSKEILEHDRIACKPDIGRIYTAYQEKLFKSSAMDFDDIIFNFYNLITYFPEVLEKYQQRFKYILVDEFQDTNSAQYSIIKLIAAPQNNICVVGDDAQSIYAFRGAKIDNIFDFQKDYPNLSTFKLEQNYRSTKHIVGASNSVIDKNKAQIHKDVWTDNDEGDLIKLIPAVSDNEEASKVVSAIFEKKMNDHLRNDAFAILYRTNAQSRAFEEALRRMNIPYRIYGGLSFYQRKEIKDLLSYFRLIVNNNDEEALSRIINYPPRGIGQTTFEKIQNAASELKVSTWSIICNTPIMQQLNIYSTTCNKIDAFATMIKNFSYKLKSTDAQTLAKDIAHTTGILRNINEDNTPEGLARIKNVEELINAIGDFSEKRGELVAVDNMGEIDDSMVTLDMFMQDVALLTDQDAKDDDDTDKVQLMTIHSAKGLEFPNVFVVGLEENLFPSPQAVFSREDLEEERRLLYVACTRAEKSLTLSYAENRYRWGMLQCSEPSRFLKDFDYSHFCTHDRAGQRFREISTPVIHGFGLNNIRPQGQQHATPKTSPIIMSTDANEKPSDYNLIKVNDNVYHEKFGAGVVISVEGVGPNRKAKVNFNSCGEKMLLLRFAKLTIL